MTQRIGITETTIGPTMGEAVMGVDECRELIENLVWGLYSNPDCEPPLKGDNGFWAIHFALDKRKFSWACHAIDGITLIELAEAKDGTWVALSPALTSVGEDITLRNFFRYVMEDLSPHLTDDDCLELTAKRVLFGWLVGDLPSDVLTFKRTEPFCPWAEKVLAARDSVLGRSDDQAAGFALMSQNIDTYEPDQMEGFFRTRSDALLALYHNCRDDDHEAEMYFSSSDYYLLPLYYQDPEDYAPEPRPAPPTFNADWVGPQSSDADWGIRWPVYRGEER